MRKHLSLKFMLRTAIVVTFGISVLGWIMTRSLGSEVRSRSDREATDQVSAVLNVLQTVDNLSSQSVRCAMSRWHNSALRTKVSRHSGATPSTINKRLFAALCLIGLIAS
jgi:hypothetical protein